MIGFLIFISAIVLLVLEAIVVNLFATPAPIDFSYPDLNNLSESDKEFLSRLPAKTDPRVALKVRQIVAEQAGADIDEVWPETKFVEDLGFC